MKISKPTYMKVVARPEDFDSSHKDSKVIGAFNSGATAIETSDGIKTLLLVRVAETYKGNQEKSIMVPRWDYRINGSPLVFDEIYRNSIEVQGNKEVKYLDPTDNKSKTRLKHISRLERRILEEDGTLKEWGRGTIPLEHDFSEYGMEDARITSFNEELMGEIGYKYCVTYVCPHNLYRVSTVAMLTNDFINFAHFPLGNTPRPIKNGKDVALLPGRYSGVGENIFTRKKEMEFGILVRPSEHSAISTPGITLEYSPNLTAMGLPHRLIGNGDGATTGTGAPPVEIGNELVAPVHYAIPYGEKEAEKMGHSHYYETRLLKMDAKNPWDALIDSEFRLTRDDFKDILPERGYVPNVVYTIGMIINSQKDEVKMIHGVDDSWSVETRHDIE